MPLPAIPPGAPGIQFARDANNNVNGLKGPVGTLRYSPLGSPDCAGIGDSMTFNNSSGLVFGSIGYMIWLGILSDQKINFDDGLNFGVNSDTSALILARIDSVIASIVARGCRRAVCLWGTNDVNGGIALATFISNTTKIYGKLRAAGIDFVVMPIPPRSANSSATMRLVIQEFNNALRVLVCTVGARWADPSLSWSDNFTDALAYPRDGTDTPTAVVTATFLNTVMTVTATTNGVIAVGMAVAVYSGGVKSATNPQMFVSSLGTYTGASGVGTVNLDTNVGSTIAGSVTAQISAVSVTYDKLHPAPTGAKLFADAILAVVPDWLYFPGPDFVAQTDVYDATNNPTGSIFSNPMMAGSVALSGTPGISGNLATGFTLVRNLGTSASTVVASKTTIALPGGGSAPAQMLVFTAAAGEKAGWTLGATRVAATPLGTKIRCWIRMVASAITPASWAVCQLRVRDGSGPTSIGNLSPTTLVNYMPNVAWSGKIRAPDYTTGIANAIANELQFTVDGNASLSGASVTIVVSQFGGIFVP